MNLYLTTLKYRYDQEFKFYVIADNLQNAGDLALKTFESYNYADCYLHSTKLIASEGQYAKPEILLIEKEGYLDLVEKGKQIARSTRDKKIMKEIEKQCKEVTSGSLRFIAISLEQIKRIFTEHGYKHESPF